MLPDSFCPCAEVCNPYLFSCGLPALSLRYGREAAGPVITLGHAPRPCPPAPGRYSIHAGDFQQATFRAVLINLETACEAPFGFDRDARGQLMPIRAGPTSFILPAQVCTFNRAGAERIPPRFSNCIVRTSKGAVKSWAKNIRFEPARSRVAHSGKNRSMPPAARV